LIEVLVDLEISLIKAFYWSLRDIDETDVESMMAFLGRIGQETNHGMKRAFCDEVPFL